MFLFILWELHQNILDNILFLLPSFPSSSPIFLFTQLCIPSFLNTHTIAKTHIATRLGSWWQLTQGHAIKMLLPETQLTDTIIAIREAFPLLNVHRTYVVHNQYWSELVCTCVHASAPAGKAWPSQYRTQPNREDKRILEVTSAGNNEKYRR